MMTSATLEHRVNTLREEPQEDWVNVNDQLALVDDIAPESAPSDSGADPHLVISLGALPPMKSGLVIRSYEESLRTSDIQSHLFVPSDWYDINEELSQGLARVVIQSREVLGSRIAAYLGNLYSDSLLDDWSVGLSRPSEVVVERLRLASEAASIIGEWDGQEIARSWLAGQNQYLGGAAPIRVLREDELEIAGPKVLSAARAFIAGA